MPSDVKWTFGVNSYDEEGCLLLKRSISNSSDATYYHLNVQNQLVSVESPSMTAIFTYDALGRRIGKTVDGVETRYLYDGQNVRLESEGGVSWTHAMTSSGIDQWLCREDLETGEQLFYHTDGANSTIAVTDGSGSVVERYIYSAYGEVDTLSPDLQTRLNAPSQSYTYTGREWDNGIGMYHYRARYYNPSMGRFISCDPIGIVGGLNLYAYANNNPMKWLDPMGLSPATVSGAGSQIDPSNNHDPITTGYMAPYVGPAQNDPKSVTDPELFVAVDIDFAPIFGAEVTPGIVWNLKDFLESGIFIASGPSGGANLGLAVAGGYAHRGVEGTTLNVDANLAVPTPTISIDEYGVSGGSLGLGAGKGLSVSVTEGNKYTLRNFGQDLANVWNSVFGD